MRREPEPTFGTRGKSPCIFSIEFDQLRREAERSEIEALAHPALRELLLREAVAEVDQKARAEDVNIVERDAAVDAVQDDAVDVVAEDAVLVLLPVIAVEADEHAVLVAEGVVHAADGWSSSPRSLCRNRKKLLRTVASVPPVVRQRIQRS